MSTDVHTILLIDDEVLARDSIKVLLSGNKRWQIVGEATDGNEAIRLIDQLKPHLIFLDINMPGINGLDLLKHVRHKPHIVFVTAYDAYAVKAFEENAVDYLLKPYTDKRFLEALARVKSKIEEHESHQKIESISRFLNGQSSLTPKVPQKIAIQMNDRIILLDVNEVLWVKAAGNYVELFTMHHKYLHYDSMNNMEHLLPEPEFVRIHRSHIVRRDQIRSLRKHSNGEFFAVLKNAVELKVSRSQRNKVETIIGT